MAQQSSCLSSHWRINCLGLLNNISIIIWCIIFRDFFSPNYLSWHEIDVIQPENKWQQETITRLHNKAVVSLHTEELFGTFKQYFHNYLMHYFSRFLSPNYLSWHEIDVIQPENKWQQETITRLHNKAFISLSTKEDFQTILPLLFDARFSLIFCSLRVKSTSNKWELYDKLFSSHMSCLFLDGMTESKLHLKSKLMSFVTLQRNIH